MAAYEAAFRDNEIDETVLPSLGNGLAVGILALTKSVLN
jgi:hypothetical protein